MTPEQHTRRMLALGAVQQAVDTARSQVCDAISMAEDSTMGTEEVELLLSAQRLLSSVDSMLAREIYRRICGRS